MSRKAEHKAKRTDPSSRRKFLRNSAAIAPAVLTLPSGASAAAYGSIAQCVKHIDDQPDYLHVEYEDDWGRRSVPAIHVIPKESDPNGGVSADDPIVLVKYGRRTYVDGNNEVWGRKWNGDYISPLGETFVETYERSERHTVVFVDDYGNVLGVHPKYRHSGRAVYGSCWVSILPRTQA